MDSLKTVVGRLWRGAREVAVQAGACALLFAAAGLFLAIVPLVATLGAVVGYAAFTLIAVATLAVLLWVAATRIVAFVRDPEPLLERWTLRVRTLMQQAREWWRRGAPVSLRKGGVWLATSVLLVIWVVVFVVPVVATLAQWWYIHMWLLWHSVSGFISRMWSSG